MEILPGFEQYMVSWDNLFLHMHIFMLQGWSSLNTFAVSFVVDSAMRSCVRSRAHTQVSSAFIYYVVVAIINDFLGSGDDHCKEKKISVYGIIFVFFIFVTPRSWRFNVKLN